MKCTILFSGENKKKKKISSSAADFFLPSKVLSNDLKVDSDGHDQAV